MTLICFASQKGSPGATATALSVAASLKLADGRRKVLLEADTTGGTLAIRYRLPVEPGLLTLAAAVRGGLDNSDGLWRHTQELPGGLPVIVCPDGPEQVHAAMAAGGAQLGRFLNGLRDVDVMCDVGRLSPDSPALPFVAEASAVLMVARPTAEQLQPAARRMLMLRPLVSNLGWVLVGQKPYGPADVEATYDFPVVGVIADDPRSVQLLERGTVSKRLRRQPFIRSATTLADTLSAWLSPLTVAAPADQAPAAPTTASAVTATAAVAVSAEPPEMLSEPEATPVAETPPIPADVDLTLLPPPAGEPDTTTPNPLLDAEDESPEPIAETEVRNDAPEVDEASASVSEFDELPEAEDVSGADVLESDEASEVLEDWDPPVVADPPAVPALASAPLVPSPAPVPETADPSFELVSDETDPFPTESIRPVPPPPAPTGTRVDADPVETDATEEKSEESSAKEDPVKADLVEAEPVEAKPVEEEPVEASTNGFAVLAEPGGLGWDDLEPVLPSADAPPLPPPSTQNGTAVLNGSPPVPPPALSIDPPMPPQNGTPPVPPSLLMLDQQNGQDVQAAHAAQAAQVDQAENFSDPEPDELDDWDGSEFTVTADLTNVFSAPDFDAPPIQDARTEPPMPPVASVPPLPPASTQLNLDADDDRQPPPSPFPHEDSGADWNGW